MRHAWTLPGCPFQLRWSGENDHPWEMHQLESTIPTIVAASWIPGAKAARTRTRSTRVSFIYENLRCPPDLKRPAEYFNFQFRPQVSGDHVGNPLRTLHTKSAKYDPRDLSSLESATTDCEDNHRGNVRPRFANADTPLCNISTLAGSRSQPWFEVQIEEQLGTPRSDLRTYAGTQPKFGLLDDRCDRSI